MFYPDAEPPRPRLYHLREGLSPAILLRGDTESIETVVREQINPKDQLESPVNPMSVPADPRQRFVPRPRPRIGGIDAA
jgi:hypothetical protein